MPTLMQESEYSERLNKVLNYFGLKPAELAREIVCAPATISKILNKGRGIGRGLAESIFRRYGVSIEWLRFGKGEMLSKEGQHSSDDDNLPIQAMRMLTDILASQNEIYIKAVMSSLAAFADAVRSGRGGKTETPQGMVVIEDRRKNGERRKNPDPDWPAESEKRQGGDRRKASSG